MFEALGIIIRYSRLTVLLHWLLYWSCSESMKISTEPILSVRLCSGSTLGLANQNKWITLICLLARFLIMTYSALEIMRQLLGIGLVITMFLLQKNVKNLWDDYQLKPSIMPKVWHVRMYSTILITIQIAAKPQVLVVLVLLCGMGAGIILCIIAIIRFYVILPWNMYIIAVLALIILVTIVQFCLPQAIRISEDANEMRRRWKYDLRL
jgi:hypothetical protein